MRNVDFVESIKNYVRDTSILGTIDFIKKPPGRKPRKRHLELSSWYNSLPEKDKEMVLKIMTEAVDASLFSFLSVLDGVRTIENSDDKSTFELYSVKEGQKTRINIEDEEPLHDIYNELTNPVD